MEEKKKLISEGILIRIYDPASSWAEIEGNFQSIVSNLNITIQIY